MTDFTTYTEGQIADWLSQGTDMPVAPATLYVALHTSNPGQSPDGTTEVTGTNYSRYASSAGTDWGVSGTAPTSIDNANLFAFNEAGGSWGTITHVSLWDGAADTDNALAAYALTNSISVADGDRVEFPSGSLSFNID